MADPQTPYPRAPTGITRLAPSPTGALHLGNARTFLINWALARQSGWRIVLRIEDLDGPRIKPGADRMAIDDLRWLGLDWDEGPTTQLADLTPYRDALARLHRDGLVYPCVCSRRDIESAQSAPHGDDHELRYPGTCRQRRIDPRDAAVAWRIRVPDEPVVIHDEIRGRVEINVQQEVGDFVVSTRSQLPAYQLAVVVDDARQGVDAVVRGDDLLGSAARQWWLYHWLGLTPLPRYWHLPLVQGPDGRRLAKRHGDTRLAFYRDAGVRPERVVGLLAHWSGLTPLPQAMSARCFLDHFDLARLPRQPITFTIEHHAWLLGQE